MTLDEAIEHAEEVTDKKEREKQKWEKWLETDSDYRAVAEKVSCELCAEEHRQLAEWMKELKQLREHTRWIPVKERLPEKNMECLVTVGDFNLVQTAMYSNLMRMIDHRIFYQGECGDENFKNITQYVKAWMPLPQPFKEESEEV